VAARSKARKRALDVLYEADVRAVAATDTLSAWVTRADPPVQDYTRLLVEGVASRRGRIDDVITAYSGDWPLERMPPVDRNILRLAVYEMLHEQETPKLVVLDEAIELAKKFGSEQSGRLVNGLLDGLLKQHTFPGSLT